MAKRVAFLTYDFRKDKQIASGSLTWNGKKMVATPGLATKLLADLEEGGVSVPGGGKKRLFPQDGEAFLDVLKYRYDNAYLQASDVTDV